MLFSEIKKLYLLKKDKVSECLKDFENLYKIGTDYEIFSEMCFCILTPQSKAEICWDAIICLKDNKLLFKGNSNDILKHLQSVRFKNKKAKYIIKARKFFTNNGKINIKRRINKFKDIYKLREFLVENIKGLGYKETSHFLRNIGLGKNLAILDRHILKNLKLFGIIKEIPTSISKSKYLEIEQKMKNFAKTVNIPISHLDFVLWYKETGVIFK
jgi:N-glycosylase/DNA lyase